MLSAKMKHWQDPTSLALGLWLVASPWLLGFNDNLTATQNFVVVGILVAALALFELFQVAAWEEWASFALGVWLAISPWLLGFSAIAAAMFNALVVGILIAGLALWALGTDKDIGGWWSRETRAH